jgi:hypothetical protein
MGKAMQSWNTTTSWSRVSRTSSSEGGRGWCGAVWCGVVWCGNSLATQR